MSNDAEVEGKEQADSKTLEQTPILRWTELRRIYKDDRSEYRYTDFGPKDSNYIIYILAFVTRRC